MVVPFVEPFLVAAIAGTVAGITVGWINRKLMKLKRLRARWCGGRSMPVGNPGPSTAVRVDVNVA
jgi:hypothetical protein